MTSTHRQTRRTAQPLMASRFLGVSLQGGAALLYLALALLLLFSTEACQPGLLQCRTDADCKTPNPVCLAGLCRACRTTADCPTPARCTGFTCLFEAKESQAESPTEPPKESQAEPPKETRLPEDAASIEAEGLVTDLQRDDIPLEPLPETDCSPGDKRSCKSTFPNCDDGLQTCTDAGRWGTCFPKIEAEVCNGKDDDCNGRVDESFAEQGKGCMIPGSFGVCAQGALACEKGQQTCLPKESPSPEVCDGKDNDCDGQIDNAPGGRGSLARPCFTSKKGCTEKPDGSFECQGLCKAGAESCKDGVWPSTCVGVIAPVPEICDGLDNDCNGKIDESFPIGQPCTQGLGACKASGVFVCSADHLGVSCNASPSNPGPEMCDGKDGDCDGKTDEGCACQNGITRSCGSSTGECKTGTQNCIGGQWGTCTGSVSPTPEICDGKDNDCDGKTDEFFPDQGQSCLSPGQIGVCQTSIWACNSGQQTCPPSSAAKEICDGKDNDCDGKTDESLQRSCYTGTTGCSLVTPPTYTCEGSCQSGFQVCSGGQWEACQGQVLPSSEVCNAKDDDCDGKTDEMIFCVCIPGRTRACGTDVGECKTGVQVCGTSGWGPCINETPPALERCDGKDNDCDGKVDETFPDQGQACTIPEAPLLPATLSCCGGITKCGPPSCSCSGLCTENHLGECRVGCRTAGGLCNTSSALSCNSASDCLLCTQNHPQRFICKANTCVVE